MFDHKTIMMKDRVRSMKKKPKDEKPIPKKMEKPLASSETDKTTTFDFGGLPARDLKKNLGCG